MNELSAFERRLAAGLDAYVGPPRSVDSVTITRAAAVRPVPRRSILPGLEREVGAQRVPWRLMIVAALLVVGVVASGVFVGGRQPWLPAVTGPASNGVVAYDHAGDIFIGDPMTGMTTAIVTGPETDSRPIFSPDGTHIAFLRGDRAITSGGGSIVVVSAEGSDARVVAPPGFSERGLGFAWTPDSAWLAVNHDSRPFITPYFDGELSLVDASGMAAPRLLTPPLPRVVGAPYFLPNAHVAPIFRPPTGDLILSGEHGGLYAWDADLESRTRLAGGRSSEDVTFRGVYEPAWSPDGSMIVFTALVESGHTRLFVMNADGSELRSLSRAADDVDPRLGVEERFPSWSPDGSRIVFDRGRSDAPTTLATTFRVVVVDVNTGAEWELGAPEIDGERNDAYPGHTWSPDGRSVVVLERPGTRPLVIDAESGHAAELPWEADSPPSWQRVAGD